MLFFRFCAAVWCHVVSMLMWMRLPFAVVDECTGSDTVAKRCMCTSSRIPIDQSTLAVCLTSADAGVASLTPPMHNHAHLTAMLFDGHQLRASLLTDADQIIWSRLERWTLCQRIGHWSRGQIRSRRLSAQLTPSLLQLPPTDTDPLTPPPSSCRPVSPPSCDPPPAD